MVSGPYITWPQRRCLQVWGQMWLVHTFCFEDPRSTPPPPPPPISDLMWQRDLLLGVSNRLVIGCDDELWAAVVPATIALVCTLEVQLLVGQGGQWATSGGPLEVHGDWGLPHPLDACGLAGSRCSCLGPPHIGLRAADRGGAQHAQAQQKASHAASLRGAGAGNGAVNTAPHVQVGGGQCGQWACQRCITYLGEAGFSSGIMELR